MRNDLLRPVDGLTPPDPGGLLRPITPAREPGSRRQRREEARATRAEELALARLGATDQPTTGPDGPGAVAETAPPIADLVEASGPGTAADEPATIADPEPAQPAAATGDHDDDVARDLRESLDWAELKLPPVLDEDEDISPYDGLPVEPLGYRRDDLGDEVEEIDLDDDHGVRYVPALLEDEASREGAEPTTMPEASVPVAAPVSATAPSAAPVSATAPEAIPTPEPVDPTPDASLAGPEGEPAPSPLAAPPAGDGGPSAAPADAPLTRLEGESTPSALAAPPAGDGGPAAPSATPPAPAEPAATAPSTTVAAPIAAPGPAPAPAVSTTAAGMTGGPETQDQPTFTPAPPQPSPFGPGAMTSPDQPAPPPPPAATPPRPPAAFALPEPAATIAPRSATPPADMAPPPATPQSAVAPPPPAATPPSAAAPPPPPPATVQSDTPPPAVAPAVAPPSAPASAGPPPHPSPAASPPAAPPTPPAAFAAPPAPFPAAVAPPPPYDAPIAPPPSYDLAPPPPPPWSEPSPMAPPDQFPPDEPLGRFSGYDLDGQPDGYEPDDVDEADTDLDEYDEPSAELDGYDDEPDDDLDDLDDQPVPGYELHDHDRADHDRADHDGADLDELDPDQFGYHETERPAALELRQIAGLTAGIDLELDQAGHEFAEGDQSVAFTITVDDNDRAVLVPGTMAVKLDTQPVAEPTLIGWGALDVGSARFIVRPRRSWPGADEWLRQHEAFDRPEILIEVPPTLGVHVSAPAPEPDKSRRRFGRRKGDDAAGPTETLNAESWEFIDRIRSARIDLADRERYLHPDPAELAVRTRSRAPILGIRPPGHPLFAKVGVIVADMPWMPNFDDIGAIPDSLGPYLQPLMSLPSIPIAADLLIGPLGIVGSRAAGAACARHIILSLQALSTSELRVHVSASPERAPVWDWAYDLAVHDELDVDRGFPVVIVDGIENFGRYGLTHQDAIDHRVGVVILTDSIDDLPNYCGSVLQVDRSGSALLTNHLGHVIAGTPVGVAGDFARHLADDLVALHRQRR